MIKAIKEDELVIEKSTEYDKNVRLYIDKAFIYSVDFKNRVINKKECILICVKNN